MALRAKTLKVMNWMPDSKFALETVVPSKEKLPTWLIKMPKLLYGDKKWKFFSNGFTNQSVKACPPFLDAMLSGYTIQLSSDVLVEKNQDGHTFKWGSQLDLVAGHSAIQLSSEQIPEGFSAQPHKWVNFAGIELPRGYSGLFVHPLNRDELPFRTIAGLVDCDKYNRPVNLPFFIKDNFEGIIPAGTPIAQIIPVKREFWKKIQLPHDASFTEKSDSKFLSVLRHAYKKMAWVRKVYR